MIKKQLIGLNVPKINMNIQIVRSSRIELSAMSQVSANAILDVLEKNYSNPGIAIVNNLADLQLLVDQKPDLLFLGMQYVTDEFDGKITKIWISDFLDEHGIAYTGSNQRAHRLGINKPMSKQAMVDAGIMTSPFQVIKCNNQFVEEIVGLAYPMFVKPTSQGGGAGIDNRSIVQNIDELRLKVKSLARNNWADSLIENYLTGREFSVAVIRNENSTELTAMPIELVTQPNINGDSILSRSVKSMNDESVMRVSNPDVYTKVSLLAIKAFKALGARDYGRIDIRMDHEGTPHFLEANLIPSLIQGYGSFPKACQLNQDLEYEPMILHIINLALSRAR